MASSFLYRLTHTSLFETEKRAHSFRLIILLLLLYSAGSRQRKMLIGGGAAAADE